MSTTPDLVDRRLWRGTKKGAWLKVPLSTVNGTELESQEWCDILFLRYGIESPEPPPNCDGCGNLSIK